MNHLIDSEILEYLELMEFESDVTNNELKIRVESHINDCKKCRDILESLEKKMFYTYKYTPGLIEELRCRSINDEDSEILSDDIYDPKKIAQETADECIRNNDEKAAVIHLKDYFQMLALEDDIESQAYIEAYKKYSTYPFFKEQLMGIVQEPPIEEQIAEYIVSSIVELIKRKIANYFINVKMVDQNIFTTLELPTTVNRGRLVLGSFRSKSQNVDNDGFILDVNNGRTFIEIDCGNELVDFELALIDENKNEYKGCSFFEGGKVKFDFGVLPVNKKYQITVIS